jgi:hypothetical protein
MKTTLQKSIEAYKLINNLNSVRMKSTATSRKLFGLKTLLKPNFEFYMEEEQKLVDDLGGKITEDGKIIFADQEEGTKKFLEGREELNKTECEIAIDTPIIFRDAEGVQVSGNDIETLQGLADFIE